MVDARWTDVIRERKRRYTVSATWSKSLSEIEKAAISATCQGFIDTVLKPEIPVTNPPH